MDSRPKYKSTLAFTDLLFNILIGFAFMFIVAFILINPIQRDADIEAKAEFMITMTWDDKSVYDVDMWMQDPVGNKVGFPNMHAGLLHLDKDDLGISNDTVLMPDGSTKIIYLNREVMTIRGIIPGEYIVNNHLYSMKLSKDKKPIEVMTKIIKLNPYSEVHTGMVILAQRGAEKTVIRFVVNENGDIISKNNRQKRFAGKHAQTLQSGAVTLPGAGIGGGANIYDERTNTATEESNEAAEQRREDDQRR
jgi:hypothetical protein|tara:strand:+ start:1032 stop:1781 length:750 start_codon:yes stop_codon:yes gene_type:complete